MSTTETIQKEVFERQKPKSDRQPPRSVSAPHVSWPILLAVIPAFGTFFAGNTDIWSDFVMLFLILYYVYKWMTVSWSYYESARSRRILHQNASSDDPKRKLITAELRRHELAGLVWVVVSPAIAGYTLQYSRYLLSNVDRYINSFNVTVFVLAATIKPLSHVIDLLHERTLYLQTEAQITDSQVQQLQKKIQILEEDISSLCDVFATKNDLGQVAGDINPALHQLERALKRFERRDVELRSWSKEQFTSIDIKLQEFNDYIYYHTEQQQNDHGMVISIILLPLNVSLWAVKRMTTLLPAKHNLLTNKTTFFSNQASTD